jgi:acetyl esterase/lipase
MPHVPPGRDAATGVVSRDVTLSPHSFARLYLPPAATGETTTRRRKLPVLVYFHGGGFVMGSAGSAAYHRCLNDLAAACPAVAVSVDYRLAPEHPVPAAYEDSLAALQWALSASDPWLAAHGDPSRVFLAGDSAGGNICHHLAMHPDVRHAHVAAGGGLRLRGVVLIHPWFWGKEPIGGEPRGAAAKKMQKGLWEFVCPGAVGGEDDPRMNPTAPGAPALESLACEKVLVCVAERDVLRWRGKLYAEAVARARGGCCGEPSVELFESEGVGHVFYLLEPAAEKAKELLDRIAAFVSAD